MVDVDRKIIADATLQKVLHDFVLLAIVYLFLRFFEDFFEDLYVSDHCALLFVLVCLCRVLAVRNNSFEVLPVIEAVELEIFIFLRNQLLVSLLLLFVSFFVLDLR